MSQPQHRWLDVHDRVLADGLAKRKSFREIAAELGPPFTHRGARYRARHIGLRTLSRKQDVAPKSCRVCEKLIPVNGMCQAHYNRRVTCSVACSVMLAGRAPRPSKISRPPSKRLGRPGRFVFGRLAEHPSPPAPITAATVAAQVAEFMATKEITRCPTKYVGVTPNAALQGDAAERAIKKIVPTEKRNWRGAISPTSRLAPAAITP